MDVWWPGDEEWYTASVLKTRTEPHTIDGTKALCREIFCETMSLSMTSMGTCKMAFST